MRMMHVGTSYPYTRSRMVQAGGPPGSGNPQFWRFQSKPGRERPLWQTPWPMGRPLVALGDRIYLRDPRARAELLACRRIDAGPKDPPLWSVPIEAGSKPLVTSLLIAGDTLVAAGIEEGKPGGFLRTFSLDGKPLARVQLPAIPAEHGLAVAQGRLYVSFENGEIACYGR